MCHLCFVFPMVEKVACVEFEANPCDEVICGLIGFFLLKKVFCLFWVLPPNFTTCLFPRQKQLFLYLKAATFKDKKCPILMPKSDKNGGKCPKNKWVPLSHLKGGRSWQSKCSANLRIGGRSSQQSKRSTTWGVGALDIPGVLRISGWRWGSQRSKCSINLGGLSTAQVFD